MNLYFFTISNEDLIKIYTYEYDVIKMYLHF